VSANGGNYTIEADAQDNNGQHVAPVALSRFQVGNAVGAPDTAISQPVQKQVFSLPAVAAPVPITVKGTATDTAGAHPGVDQVKLVVLNLQHTEYWCGSPGCAAPGTSAEWTTVFTAVNVPITGRGTPNASFTITWPSYDHPHDYRVTAWAIDNDGNPDPFKASVNKICVRLPGDNTCN
jgi:hypothetical protein